MKLRRRRRRGQPTGYRVAELESATTELTLWPTPALLPAVHEKGRIVAAADGATPDVSLSADSISWSKVSDNSDRHDGRSVAAALLAMVRGLGAQLAWVPTPEAPPAATYAPPRWASFLVIGMMLLHAATVLFLSTLGLAYVVAPRIGPLESIPPAPMDPAPLAIAALGVASSLALSVVVIGLQVRELRR